MNRQEKKDKMKKLNLWMLGCILFCGLTLTGCTDDDDVVAPRPGDDGGSSAVDSGTWPDLSQYMDTSVNPGDDFFMYCNGTYWKNTADRCSRISARSP